MVNDVSIMAGIIAIFILSGILIPFVQEDFGVTTTTFDTDGLEQDVGDGVEGVTSINAFTVLFSVIKMFFWTFGALPFWLDAIFLIFRIILAFLVARNIWIGGGA